MYNEVPTLLMNTNSCAAERKQAKCCYDVTLKKEEEGILLHIHTTKAISLNAEVNAPLFLPPYYLCHATHSVLTCTPVQK